MSLLRSALSLTAIALVLAGCDTSIPSRSSGGGTEQLRLSLRVPMRAAGVSDACIARLDLNALAQIKGITSQSPNNSMEVLLQQQRIRAVADNACT